MERSGTACVELPDSGSSAPGLTDERSWEKGIRDLRNVAESEDGTFCYTFFKGIGTKL